MFKLQNILIIYLILIIVLFLLFRYGLLITWWSALVLALLIGLIYLSIISPISSINKIMGKSNAFAIYCLIIIVSLLIIIFYLITKAVLDFDYVKFCEKNKSSR